CITNLLEFYDKITEVRQEREGWVDCIFLDCKKAFDTVPHKRLVQKLEHQAHITGRALQWIREYLTGRQQRVMVRNDVSQWAPVTSGVPQGSDLMEGLDSEVSLFADDVKLMRRIKSDEDQAGLQRDLDRLDTWSSKWLLEFNPAKCKVMKIGEGQRRPQTEYRLGGQRLQTSLKEKDLGVSITPSMSPEAHINQITAAAYGRLANLRTAFRHLNKESFRTLYTVYVRPILEYAAPVWNPCDVVQLGL
ncbi:reverse transcriptase domain-containing protein, partial [Oceanicella sp. SM1341]|uniref:reverse transcriptase domain-containing protein n=1 Tax=Oceanicella sp. SM1341 TaxID=1548889 RepID=UPI0013006C1E